ncbi:SIR2 family protein [Sphingomonas sp. RB1R13]|uniref:SIR2 family protein n=1 Tax=Sphingomonas sp. RB1R13 TaxID=3096159 RepID=UPI002FC99CDA
MRFLHDGPVIPPHLLTQRNEGNVIFFCGAGISRRAGLPDFAGLTQKVVAKLGAEKARDAMERGDSSDRVFSLLVREFGQSEVDREIYSALKVARKPDLSCHRTILDLSRGADGRPQLVTTNFDFLFEAVEKRIPRVVPPALPDLSLQPSIDGVVYLHGRLRKPEVGVASGYVISSADFGRAYLSEGWATRFVKALRERYTIVLLGYRAEDPPMRYLLEGLNAADGVSYDSPIYAFTQGDEGDAEEEWQDRGVTPVCYSKSDDHAGLWNTLSAWAEAVRNPEGWNDEVIGIAQKRPIELAPHERGQVVELVSSKQGAKLFADAQPAPSAEWICVFDANVRYAEPRKWSWDDDDEIDPLDLYGLDDDLPRPPREGNAQQVIPGFNPLDWKNGDASFPERTGLRGWDAQWANPLPERLHHLARWFGGVMHQPVAVWWAAGWKQLNPNMLWFVSRRLDQREADIPPEAGTFWRLYLESCDQGGSFNREYGWFDFRSMVGREGWSGASLRFFERVSQPHVKFSRERFGRSYPIDESWEDLRLRRLVHVNVRVLDRHNEELEIPDNQLAAVIAVVRRSLLTASNLLDEIGTDWWQTPTLHPTGERGESFHGRKTLHFLWIRDLFDRLVNVDPEAAALELTQWPINDTFFFGKLSIYAAMSPEVVPASKVAALLSDVDDRIFWDPYGQRELLYTLRARWVDFTSRQRRSIERRIAKGPERWEDEKASDFRRRKSVHSAERLKWLELNACALTPVTEKALIALSRVDPSWSDDWARGADRSLDSRGGMVERVTDTRGIEAAPIGRILDEARAKTESRHGELQDFRPFEGLVMSRPFRALAALRFALRRGEAPLSFWEALLSNWPDGHSLRLRWLAAHTVAELPADALESLRHYVPRWFEKYLKDLADADRACALAAFDKVIASYVTASPNVTASGVGHTTIGGVVQDRSEVSVSKAINGPIGRLAEALWKLMPSTATKQGQMPDGVGERLEVLFGATGDGGGHAACVVATHFPWLDYWFPEWSDRVLRPMFAICHPLSEAVWHGFGANPNWPSTRTLRILCPDLLAMLKGEPTWEPDESDKRHWVQKMVILTRPENDGGPPVSFKEARDVLVAIDDKGRGDALWMLANIASEQGTWDTFVKPFIEQAWPRQVKFRTETVSRSFARLVEQSGDSFPDVVRTVVGLLRPVAHLDMITYRLSKEAEQGTDDFARKFPAETLLLLDALIAEDRSQMPYELGKTLDVIAEADPKLRRTMAWRRLYELTV